MGGDALVYSSDKSGAEVVSYSYDSFGKLTPSKAELDDANDTDKNGITVSLATTVGIKNPYLYRGYRYDNPSWGRFINADAIIGSAGELLGHNVFAYCKNNFVNGKDPSGFRPVYTEGEETEAMSQASYRAMNTASRNRSSNSSISNLGNQFIESGINLSINSFNIATEVSINKGLRQTVGWSFTIPMSVYGAKAKDFKKGMRTAIPTWLPQMISTFKDFANKPIPSIEEYFVRGVTEAKLREVSSQQIQDGKMF